MYLNRSAAELAMDDNHYDIVKLLIFIGADVSPLDLAISFKGEAKARNFIESGADISKKDTVRNNTSPYSSEC